MDLNKLKETVERIALDALVPPEICVVTRDTQGMIEVWWSLRPTSDKCETCLRVFDDLYISTDSGNWYIPNRCAPASRILVGQSDIKITFCSEYNNLAEFVNDTVGEIKITGEVSAILNKISESSKVVYPEIETLYRADGLIFETVEAAQDHMKSVKLFNLFLESHPDADYMENEGLIKFMIANPDKFVDILKG